MLFANNCNTTLNGGITAIATSMVVTSATGFPAPTGSQYFYCTLADAATQTTIEIVKVTAVSGTTFTIVRGQDGTTGTIFASGAVVSLRLVRANLTDFALLDEANTFSFAPTFNTALAVGSGGTGLTSLTAGYIPYGNGTSAFNSSSTLYFNPVIAGGVGLGIGTTSPLTTVYAVSNTSTGLAFGFDATAYGGRKWAIGDGYAVNGQFCIVDLTAGAQRFGISSTGGVMIGNTTDPGAGNLRVTGKTRSIDGFYSVNGALSLVVGVPSLIIAATEGTYLVSATFSGNNPNAWSAWAVVVVGNSAAVVATQSSIQMLVTVVGQGIYLATTSNNGTYTWSALRIPPN